MREEPFKLLLPPGRAVLKCRQLGLFIDDGGGKLRLGNAAGAGKIRAAEISLREVCLIEIGSSEIRRLQVYTREVRTAKIGIGEHALANVRLVQARILQIGSCQVDVTKFHIA